MTADARTLGDARGLMAAGRTAEALALLAPLAARRDAPYAVLSEHAAALKMAGRLDEAVVFNHRAVGREPGNRIAWHNYAATLGDLGRAAESEAAVRRALGLGLDRAEPHLVLGRALTLQQRFDEAETAFRRALALNPAYADAHRDLAQLVWMRTGDPAAALSAFPSAPQDPALIRARATVQQFTGDLPGAIATLEAGLAARPHPLLLVELAALKTEAGDAPAALALSRAALAAAPGFKRALEAYGQACLGTGDAAEAARVGEDLLTRDPHDQLAILILSTAWRLLGDPRAESLTAPERFVRAYVLPTPEGWPDLPAFLEDLKRVLRGLHGFKAHPLQQSLRGGSQAQSLLQSDDPVLKAFFRSADRVVADHIAWLGQGDDPVRARVGPGGGRIKTAWSVLLRPGGFHVSHFHPEGWLSSAFYAETPAQAIDAGDRAGWLGFGKPAFATIPPLEALHHVRPEPGTLVLFPSYMWHGTTPFETVESRMSIAFDVVPG